MTKPKKRAPSIDAVAVAVPSPADCLWLYAFYNQRADLVKIGVSRDPSARRESLSFLCGESLEVLYQRGFPSEFSRYRERYMHEYFREYRTMGEWFALPAEIRTALREVMRDA